jgi:hypothetical protein
VLARAEAALLALANETAAGAADKASRWPRLDAIMHALLWEWEYCHVGLKVTCFRRCFLPLV